MKSDYIKKGVTYYYFKEISFYNFNQNFEVRTVEFVRTEKRIGNDENLISLIPKQWTEYIFKDLENEEEYAFADILPIVDVMEHKSFFGNRIFITLDDLIEEFEKRFEFEKELNIKIDKDTIEKSKEIIKNQKERIRETEEDLSNVDEKFENIRDNFNKEISKFK